MDHMHPTNDHQPAAAAPTHGIKAWLPVISLTLSTFIFNTSEFIPIGLLSDIAADFDITESYAGLMITVYAWAVALASLPLMLIFAKTENRKLMLAIVTLFAVSHIFSAIAPDFQMLMLSRMGVACAHAIFWSIVTPLAVRVAPEGKRAAALSIVVAGSSLAMIVGLPLGRAIGISVGWRVTFLIIGLLAVAVLAFLAAVLRKTPSEGGFSLRKLPALIKTPALWGIYLLTIITISGHFTAYSYIEPFLAQVAHMGNNTITVILTLYGIVGLVGSIFFSKYYDAHPAIFLHFAIVGICLFLLLLHAAALTPWSAIAVCICWGLAINFFNLVFQSEVIRNAPQGTAVAMSIYSGIYNVGIGTGALVGGSVCDGIGIPYIGYVGGAIALAATIYYLRRVAPTLLAAAGKR